MRKIKDVHDITFKSLMTNQKMAEDFFNEYLPANIKEVVDLSTLKLCSETYISEELEKSESDLLFSVNIRDKKGYIMLLPEHQSRADKWMALRIANYTCSIMHKHSKQYPNERLPLIIPVVFFHSKKAYPYIAKIT